MYGVAVYEWLRLAKKTGKSFGEKILIFYTVAITHLLLMHFKILWKAWIDKESIHSAKQNHTQWNFTWSKKLRVLVKEVGLQKIH